MTGSPVFTVWECFQRIAAAYPAQTALCTTGQTLTYAQVTSQVEQLADRLRREGLRTGQRVAVNGVASVDFVVLLLAILRLGAAYVPLSGQDPHARQRTIVDNCEPALIVEVVPNAGTSTTRWDGRITRYPQPARDESADTKGPAESAAYVMYTSGSTGAPKGAIIPQRGVLGLVVEPNWVALGTSTCGIALAPTAFDASTFEIWAPLLNGGTLVLPDPSRRSLHSIAADIARRHVTHLWLPAGVFSLAVDHCLDALSELRFLIAGGDVLSPRHVERAAATLATCQVANGYGPTENTTFSTVYHVPIGARFDRSVPIGTAVSGTTLRILDEEMSVAEPGSPGQLAVGGTGLTLGYLGEPRLTAQKLIKDPAAPDSDAVVFLTGDYVLPLADGNLAFLGRADGLTKIRGFRVELGEIESALLKDPRVDQAVVLAEGADHDRRLAAFAVPTPGARLTPDELRLVTADRLPDYMVPSSVKVLQSLPLTRNGKLDRDRLLAPPPDPGPTVRATMPTNELERRLVNVFQTVLGTAPIGIDDDFTDLGGDSLAALELAETIHVLFGANFDPHELLGYGTPAAISARLRSGLSTGSVVVPLQPRGSLPPVFCVHGGGGEVLFLAGIRRYLSEDRPFFGLRPPGLNDEAPILRSVAAYADVYATAIHDARPNRPCVVGGLCFGGNIAVETARRLRTLGDEVEAVILFDTVYPGRGGPIVKEFLRYAVPKWARFAHAQISRRPTSETASAPSMFSWLHAGPLGRVEWAILTAVLRYRPAPYEGRIAAFLGDGGDFSVRRLDPRLAWIQTASNGLDVRHVTGRRSRMFSGDNARTLARTLDAFLADVEGREP